MKRLISLMLSVVMLATAVIACDFSALADDVTEIWTVEDLYNIRYDMSGNYKLMTDLDMTDAVADGGEYSFMGTNGWEPIGSNSVYYNWEFTGTFDGDNHTIYGLTIYLNNSLPSGTSDDIYVGLFSFNSGIIKNVNICVDKIYSIATKVNKYTGAIVAYNNGIIENCHVFGGKIYSSYSGYNLNGYQYTGGITGFNQSKILYCSNSSLIETAGKGYFNRVQISYGYQDTKSTLSSYCGGICGYNVSYLANVEFCYNIGNIWALRDSYSVKYISGISSGISNDATIKNCYNAANIYFTSSSNVSNAYTYVNAISTGCLTEKCYSIGTENTPLSNIEVKDCYYLNGSCNSITGATALSEVQMKKEISFEGFDFENTWIIDSTTNYKYPQLRNNRQDTDKEIDTIEFKAMPTKTSYVTGDKLDVSGGVITVYYMDGDVKHIPVDKTMVSGFDNATAGNQELTVTYKGFELKYDIVMVQRPAVRRVELVSMPEKTEFVRGTALDYTGAVVKTTFANNTYELVELTPQNTTGADINKSGTYTVTYTDDGYSVSFEIKVVPVRIVGLKVIKTPECLVYTEGDEIDFTGIEVGLLKNDGSTERIANSELVFDYSSEAGTQPVTVTANVDAAIGLSTTFDVVFQHDFISSTVAPTCDGKGYQLNKCVICGSEEKTNYVDALGHDYSVADSAEATCENAGYTAYTCKTCGHSYTDVIKAKGHKYNSKTTRAASCSLPGEITYTCSICSDSYTEETNTLPHSYTYSITTQPTCNSTGIKTYTCVNCSHKYVEAVEALQHNPVTDSAVEPTCTTDGKTEGSHCSLCGEVFVAQKTIPAAHKWNNGVITKRASCTENGVKTYTCTACADTKTEPIIAQGHNYTEKVIAPTCTEKGYTENTCLECGDTYKGSYTAPAGHNAVTLNAVAPTCTQSGLTEGSYCSVCGDDIVKQTVIDAKGHNAVTDEAKAPTCTEAGLTEGSHCSVCGEILVAQNTINSKGHSWNNGVVTTPATCTQNGEVTYTCETCGDTYKQNIDKLPHNFSNNAEKCSVCGSANPNYVAPAPSNPTPSNSTPSNSTPSNPTPSTPATDATAPAEAPSNVSVPKITLSSVKSKKSKQITVSWKKNTKVNGYEIQYSTDKKFKKSVKKVTIKKNKTTSTTVKKLKSKKKYYVRIRAYKTVNGKKYYSAWSKAKTVKVK